jgi:hypothetical protein
MAWLEVQLPVCPDSNCRHVGKLPNQASLKGYCTGSVSEGTAHRKRRMVPVTFRGQVPELVGTAGAR